MALAITAAGMSSIPASAAYTSKKLWLGVSSATAYIDFYPTSYYWCGNYGDDSYVTYTSVSAYAYKINGGSDHDFNSSYAWWQESCVLMNSSRYTRCVCDYHGEAWNVSMNGFKPQDVTIRV